MNTPRHILIKLSKIKYKCTRCSNVVQNIRVIKVKSLSQCEPLALLRGEEANSRREETVFVSRGVGPDGPQPSAGGE